MLYLKNQVYSIASLVLKSKDSWGTIKKINKDGWGITNRILTLIPVSVKSRSMIRLSIPVLSLLSVCHYFVFWQLFVYVCWMLLNHGKYLFFYECNYILNGKFLDSCIFFLFYGCFKWISPLHIYISKMYSVRNYYCWILSHFAFFED